MTIEDAPTDPAPAPRKPRQLTQLELRKRFPLVYRIEPRTRVVTVPREWTAAHLVYMRLPIPLSTACLVHKDAKPVFEAWLLAIDKAGLTNRLLTFNGSFVPRLKRGENVPANEEGLSRHSRGIALDFNAQWNKLGTSGPKLGELGCIEELIPYAHAVGLVWGGDWHGASVDKMHLEVGSLE